MEEVATARANTAPPPGRVRPNSPPPLRPWSQDVVHETRPPHRTLFQVNVGLCRPRTLEEFMRRSPRLIDYEDATLAGELEQRKVLTKEKDQRDDRPKKEFGTHH